MKIYSVDTQKDERGDHLVHNLGCSHYPNRDRLIRLGKHASCESAIEAAREYLDPVNGCWACLPLCHERRSDNDE